ncbi:hypothetical protein DFH09DRAFT_1489159, partial [Mycena vulgaris]
LVHALDRSSTPALNENPPVPFRPIRRWDSPARIETSFGIVEYTPQAYRPADLDLFATKFTSLFGESLTRSFDDNAESNFDLEWAMNLVTGHQKVTLYQVGDPVMGPHLENFLDALDGSYCTFEGGDELPFDTIYPDDVPSGYQGHDCGTVKAANIYSAGFKEAFNDITAGNNPGCATDGFTAATGFDPVTGLGTPNFPKLLEKWLLLP